MPRPHIHDIIMVHNIWTDAPADLELQEITQQTIPVPGSEEPTTGIRQQQFAQVMHSFRPAEGFEVKWNGQTHRIAAGESRAMPRYIAEHFANKLADQILGQQDPKGTLGYVRSTTRRPAVIEQILGEVISWHLQSDVPDTANDLAVQRANQYNESQTVNNGEVASNRYGPLRPEKTPAQVTDTPKPDEDPFKKRTKEELLKEAVDLNIEVTGAETKAQLIEKIKAEFAPN